MATPPPAASNRTTPKRRLNWVVSDWYRKVLVWKLEWKAKLSGRGYSCAALDGDSVLVGMSRKVTVTSLKFPGSNGASDPSTRASPCVVVNT